MSQGRSFYEGTRHLRFESPLLLKSFHKVGPSRRYEALGFRVDSVPPCVYVWIRGVRVSVEVMVMVMIMVRSYSTVLLNNKYSK